MENRLAYLEPSEAWIVGIEPCPRQDGSIAVDSFTILLIRFSSPPDACTDLSVYIHIKPYVPYELKYTPYDSWMQIEIDIGLADRYTLTILPGIPLANGMRTRERVMLTLRAEKEKQPVHSNLITPFLASTFDLHAWYRVSAEEHRRICVSTDREEYGLSDTIMFSGTVSPADGIQTLYVCCDLLGHIFSHSSGYPAAFTVPVQPDGSFCGAAPYKDWNKKSVMPSFAAPGMGELLSLARPVRDIYHEECITCIEADKPVFCSGDPLTAAIHAVNEDGSPALGWQFHWHCSTRIRLGGTHGEAVTDENGIARIRIDSDDIKKYDPRPTPWDYVNLWAEADAKAYRTGTEFCVKYYKE